MADQGERVSADPRDLTARATYEIVSHTPHQGQRLLQGDMFRGGPVASEAL